MKRPAKIAIIVLSILFAVLLALNIWQYISGAADMGKWIEEAAVLRAQVKVHREAKEAAKAKAVLSDARMVEAELSESEKEKEARISMKQRHLRRPT